ncbi:MAG: hypothetical protein GY949_06430, partial [Gammaproteobacteria bacterium]|nr:hypothetical protein [Gammaproteobacteria bacterium]
EDGTLAAWSTTNSAVSGVSNNPGYAGSGAWGAYTSNQAVSVTSPSFSATVPAARLEIWIRRGADSFSEDTDSGENFILEYRRSDGSWAQLANYLGSGTNGQVYQDSFVLPADARHGSLSVRLRQTGGSGFDWDYWHFDNVRVTEITPSPGIGVGSCDDLEGGLSANWTVNTTTGFAGVSGATSASPTSSMFLNGGTVTVTSNVVDTSDVSFSDLTMWVRRGADSFSEDPDFGEDMVVEYLDDVGSWVTLETFTGSGTAGQVFIRSYDLPAGGRHSGFRLRYRMTAGSGAGWDFWHVDDVCFDQELVPLLQVAKLSQVLSDPINGTSGPKAIPRAYVQYTVAVVNQGPGPVDAGSLVITDPLPALTSLYVDTSSGDPVTFTDGATSSGLTYAFATDVTFSNQVGGGPPYSYNPTPDAQGFDPAVTGLRIAPTGAMNAASGGNSPSFNITLRVRIE